MSSDSPNGAHPSANGHHRGGESVSSSAPASSDPDAPGCWQLPGLLIRLVFWLAMLVLILWFLAAILLPR